MALLGGLFATDFWGKVNARNIQIFSVFFQLGRHNYKRYIDTMPLLGTNIFFIVCCHVVLVCVFLQTQVPAIDVYGTQDPGSEQKGCQKEPLI